MTRQEAGRLGGLTTYARNGSMYMAQIGSKGFATYCNLYHNGDRAAARAALKLDGRRKDLNRTDPELVAWLDERREVA